MKAVGLVILIVAATGMRHAAAQSARPARERAVAVEAPQQSDKDDAQTDLRRAKANLDQAAAQSPQMQNGIGTGLQPPDGFAPLKSRMEKGAWLGLSASPPPPALRRQLKLPEGTGLVVDFVQPRSPAQQGGLRQYDLLVKLNDQLLINAPQLGVLVRTFKPGEEIRLVLFREGQRQTLPVTLVEHDLPPLIDELLYQPTDVLRTIPTVPPLAPDRALRSRQPDGSIIQRDERSLTWLDGKRQITVSMGDDKTITVSDAKTGRVMFKGTLDALSNQTQLPDEVRDVLDRVREFLKAGPDKADQSVPKPDGRQAK